MNLGLRASFSLWIALGALCSAWATGATSSRQQPSLSSGSALGAAPSASSSKVWVGRYAAYERFLRTAAIDRTTAAGPSSQHVFFKPGGLTAGASRKAEAYKLEIAGYRFDRLLSADLVPPTVEVDANGGRAAMQLWVENVRPLAQVRSENLLPPDVARWQAQLQRAYAFENLVANLDEHEGSPIVDPHWNLIVLDHSRGFTNTLVLRYEVGKTLTQIDRRFFNRIKSLDNAAVRHAIGALVDAGAIDALLARRDSLVKALEKLATEEGPSQVFTR